MSDSILARDLLRLPKNAQLEIVKAVKAGEYFIRVSENEKSETISAVAKIFGVAKLEGKWIAVPSGRSVYDLRTLVGKTLAEKYSAVVDEVNEMLKVKNSPCAIQPYTRGGRWADGKFTPNKK